MVEELVKDCATYRREYSRELMEREDGSFLDCNYFYS